jgi:ABC-2 type transport system permease protein
MPRSDATLLLDQVRYQNKIFWRTPVAAFFTIVFPLMFLVVFTAVFGNDEIAGLGVTTGQFYAPAMAVFGAVSATYTNLAIVTALARDEGILKRVRGTPLPPWIYMAGRVGSAIFVAALAVILMIVAGVVFYDLQVYAATIPSLVVSFVLGVGCFAALGLFLAGVSPNGDTAPALANATLLPLAFISGVFFASADEGGLVLAISRIFPLRHFAVTFQDAFNPVEVAMRDGWWDHFHWPELAVMAAWLVGGVVLAIRFFRWEPTSSDRPGRRRRSAS